VSDVTYIRSRELLDAFGRQIEVSNFVRTNRDGSILRGYDGSPVKPAPFPAGNWKITDPLPRTQPDLAPFFIPTDAHRMIEVWTLTADGKYDQPSGKMVYSDAYGIHFSVLDFTWGCIRVVHQEDLLWLVEQVKAELAAIRKIDPKQAWISMEAQA
jgi:hypothetical protein